MTICFYEDNKFQQFLPATFLRPVYVLRPGILELFKRANRYFADAAIVFSCRNQIAPLVAESYSDYPVNIVKHNDTDVLFINGRVKDWGNLAEQVLAARLSSCFETKSGEICAVLFKTESLETVGPIATQQEYQELYVREAQHLARITTTVSMYNYIWDVVADIQTAVESDFKVLESSFGIPHEVRVHDGAYLTNEQAVFLGDGAEILPGAVIDASGGPVYIDSHVKVEPHATINGPCYIGPGTVVLEGKVTGSSIGHTCRVGGEVEESIFHAYVNKYHAGFIGHAFVCPWVNFGAMTTNSDLKNNYSNIRSTINGESIDTGMMKVGSFIGDHTKFGIGTLLNTGINIGVCCNIFGGNLVADKEVGSFSWGTSGNYVPYDLDKAIETARVTTERRGVSFSERERGVLESIHAGQVLSGGVVSFD